MTKDDWHLFVLIFVFTVKAVSETSFLFTSIDEIYLIGEFGVNGI